MPVDWTAIRIKWETALLNALDNPAPDYSIDGQQVSYAAYLDMLQTKLRIAEENEERANSAFVIQKRVIP